MFVALWLAVPAAPRPRGLAAAPHARAGRHGATTLSPSANAGALSERAANRIKSLQREADQLAAQSRTLLSSLRQLELTRALRAEELGR